MIPGLRQKSLDYHALSQEILEPEFEKLVSVLKTHPQPKTANLIASSVISLFHDKHPDLSDEECIEELRILSKAELRTYFNNPVVQSLPMILKAADNLTDAITLCLEQIAHDENKLMMLRTELDVSTWRAPELLKSLPVLDAFYKESVRYDAPSVVPRYTKNGYSSSLITIPKHTMVLFDMEALSKGAAYWDNPDEFDPTRFIASSNALVSDNKNAHTLNQFPLIPFSVGLRNCPAFAVTEIFFKTAIAEIVSRYDFGMAEKHGDSTMLSVSLRKDMFISSVQTP
jgi:hypothetical protein